METQVLVTRDIDRSKLSITRADLRTMKMHGPTTKLSEREQARLCQQLPEDIGDGITCQVVATNIVAPDWPSYSLAVVEIVAPAGTAAKQQDIEFWFIHLCRRLKIAGASARVLSVFGAPLAEPDPDELPF
jgi:hypothetical protein